MASISKVGGAAGFQIDYTIGTTPTGRVFIVDPNGDSTTSLSKEEFCALGDEILRIAHDIEVHENV